MKLKEQFVRGLARGSLAVHLGVAEPVESFRAYGRRWRSGMRHKKANVAFIKRGDVIEFCACEFNPRICGGIGASLWWPFAHVKNATAMKLMPYCCEVV